MLADSVADRDVLGLDGLEQIEQVTSQVFSKFSDPSENNNKGKCQRLFKRLVHLMYVSLV